MCLFYGEVRQNLPSPSRVQNMRYAMTRNTAYGMCLGSFFSDEFHEFLSNVLFDIVEVVCFVARRLATKLFGASASALHFGVEGCATKGFYVTRCPVDKQQRSAVWARGGEHGRYLVRIEVYTI